MEITGHETVKGARNVRKKGVLFIGHKEAKVSVLFQGRGV